MFGFWKKEKKNDIFEKDVREAALEIFLASENARKLADNNGIVVPCVSMINTKEFIRITVNGSLKTICATSTKEEFTMIYDAYKAEHSIDGYIDENICITLENGYVFKALASEFDTNTVSFESAIKILKSTGCQYFTLFFENGDVVLLDDEWLSALAYK